MTLSISVIIPALNEQERIEGAVARLQGEEILEVIVADGSSTDQTAYRAEQAGARVVVSPPGRGGQQNAGAGVARGDILLFLHADTRLPKKFPGMIRKTLAAEDTAAGAFRFALDAGGPGFFLVTLLTNIRARWLQLPYGDQGIFLTRKMFDTVAGFADLPAMEDFELVRRLKKKGKIAILPQAATTSARRWQELGILRTFLVNQGMIIGYYLKRSSSGMAFWYRRGGRW